MASDEPMPLCLWPTLIRPRAIGALNIAIEFLEEGRVDPAFNGRALVERFCVDQSVEELFQIAEDKEEK